MDGPAACCVPWQSRSWPSSRAHSVTGRHWKVSDSDCDSGDDVATNDQTAYSLQFPSGHDSATTALDSTVGPPPTLPAAHPHPLPTTVAAYGSSGPRPVDPLFTVCSILLYSALLWSTLLYSTLFPTPTCPLPSLSLHSPTSHHASEVKAPSSWSSSFSGSRSWYSACHTVQQKHISVQS